MEVDKKPIEWNWWGKKIKILQATRDNDSNNWIDCLSLQLLEIINKTIIRLIEVAYRSIEIGVNNKRNFSAYEIQFPCIDVEYILKFNPFHSQLTSVNHPNIHVFLIKSIVRVAPHERLTKYWLYLIINNRMSKATRVHRWKTIWIIQRAISWFPVVFFKSIDTKLIVDINQNLNIILLWCHRVR